MHVNLAFAVRAAHLATTPRRHQRVPRLAAERARAARAECGGWPKALMTADGASSSCVDPSCDPRIVGYRRVCHAMRVERNASVHTLRLPHRSYGLARWACRERIDTSLHARQLRRYLGELDRARTRAPGTAVVGAAQLLPLANVTGIADEDPASILRKQPKSLPHVIR
ncbi:MAG: hypothetical protein ACLT98_03805 [Eggerthellaceae bacterium]